MLNAKQNKFVTEYIKDWNATQAAIRAGYSKKTAGALGFELLKKPEISDAIRQIQTEQRTAAIMELDEALTILSSIARGRICDYMDEDGRIDSTKLRSNQPSAVQSIETDMHIEGSNADPTYVHTTKFKLHSPIAAIQQLAKMRGWDAPSKVDLTIEKTFADFVLESAGESGFALDEPEG